MHYAASPASRHNGVVTTIPVPETPQPETRKTFHEHLDELRVDVIRLAALTTEQIAGGTQAILDGDLVGGRRGHRERRRGRRPHPLDRGPRVPAAGTPAADRDRPAVPRDGDAGRARARAQRRSHGERGQDDAPPLPPPPRPEAPRHHRPDGRAGGEPDSASRSTRSPTQTRTGPPRSPTWTTAWTSSRRACSVTSSRATAATRPRCCLAVQMALVGRHYERIADHAVTIAERVGFMVTGEHPNPDVAEDYASSS